MNGWLALFLGVLIGASAATVNHHVTHGGDTVHVPVKVGGPADLPGWACTELTDLRVETLELSMALARERRGAPPERARGVLLHRPVPTYCPERPR